MTKFIGYTDESELPLKPGQTVTIKKGMPVRHPKFGVTGAGRTYKVKVNHILNGQTWTVGTVIRREGEEERFIWNQRDKDMYSLMARYHLPYGTNAEREASKETLRQMALKNLKPYNDKPDCHIFHACIHIENPSIRWAGTGGYWCEIDINNLLEIN